MRGNIIKLEHKRWNSNKLQYKVPLVIKLDESWKHFNLKKTNKNYIQMYDHYWIKRSVTHTRNNINKYREKKPTIYKKAKNSCMCSFHQLQVTFLAHKILLVKTFNFYSMPQPLTFVPAADSDLASMSKLLTATVLPHYCLQTTFFHEISIKISYLGCDYMSSGT
jgi:hypothetical protein